MKMASIVQPGCQLACHSPAARPFTTSQPHRRRGAAAAATALRSSAPPQPIKGSVNFPGSKPNGWPAVQLQSAARLAPSRAQPATTVCSLRNFDWPEALLFDCDGVLVDTERDGHRLAFNEAFKRIGLPHEWSVEKYGELLETGGGKERMTRYFTEVEDQEPFKSLKDEGMRKELVAELHRLKTDIFMERVEQATMPLRPGVARLVGEAIAADIPVAVCSTSNERAVSTIVRVMLGDKVAARMRVFAGDVVPKKKPDPAIYLLAAQELGVDPARCVVIEDSHIGVRAARAAGMRCVVTQSSYTADEDFSLADAVFDAIGDDGDERFSLHDLTTPGSFWVNAPNPVDKDGNRIAPQ